MGISSLDQVGEGSLVVVAKVPDVLRAAIDYFAG